MLSLLNKIPEKYPNFSKPWHYALHGDDCGAVVGAAAQQAVGWAAHNDEL